MRQLVMVAGPFGRSGVDSFCQALAGQRDVRVPAWAKPSFAATVAHSLIQLDASEPGWLPRRAGEAAAALDEAFAQTAVADAWAHFRGPLVEDPVYIPVYGTLPLPRERELGAWTSAVRAAILAGHDGRTVLRVGHELRAVHASILEHTDHLVVVVRHPVDLYVGLTESATDGMRPEEALSNIVGHYRHLERLVATYGARIFRYEGLPAGVLPETSTWTGEPHRTWADVETLRSTVAPVLDVRIQIELAEVAEQLGYVT